MNRTLVLITLLLASLSASALADTITTLRGKSYQGCRIKQVHPDGISFTHRDGAAKILFTDLPSALRSKYGYDSKKAAAYSKKIDEQRKETAKRRQEYLEREAEAIEAAQFMATMRAVQAQNQMLLSMSQQPAYVTGFASVPTAGYYNGLQGWPVTNPIHGPVVDGRHYRRGSSWDSVGIAPLVPGTGGIYAPPSGGFAYYPPVYPSLGYARPGYGISGSWNVGGGVRVGVGLGAVPGIGPALCVPRPAVVPGVIGTRGSAPVIIRP